MHCFEVVEMLRVVAAARRGFCCLPKRRVSTRTCTSRLGVYLRFAPAVFSKFDFCGRLIELFTVNIE